MLTLAKDLRRGMILEPDGSKIVLVTQSTTVGCIDVTFKPPRQPMETWTVPADWEYRIGAPKPR